MFSTANGHDELTFTDIKYRIQILRWKLTFFLKHHIFPGKFFDCIVVFTTDSFNNFHCHYCVMVSLSAACTQWQQGEEVKGMKNLFSIYEVIPLPFNISWHYAPSFFSHYPSEHLIDCTFALISIWIYTLNGNNCEVVIIRKLSTTHHISRACSYELLKIFSYYDIKITKLDCCDFHCVVLNT